MRCTSSFTAVATASGARGSQHRDVAPSAGVAVVEAAGCGPTRRDHATTPGRAA